MCQVLSWDALYKVYQGRSLPLVNLQFLEDCRKNYSKVQSHGRHPNHCGFTECVFSSFLVPSAWNSSVA